MIPALILLALLVAGCDTRLPDAGVWAGSIDTLPSGRVTVTNRGPPLWSQGEAWRLVEDLRLGAVEGTGPEVFGLVFARSDGTQLMRTLDPYAPRDVWRIDPDGGIWTAFTARKELHRIGFGGDTLRSVILETRPPPVSPEERDSVLAAFESLRAQMLTSGARPERDPRVPAVKPHLTSIYLDDRGFLWVRAEGARGEPPRLDVFDGDGRYLGAVELPAAAPAGAWVDPLIRGERLYVVESDALGVEYVVRYRIEGRGG